MESALIQMTCIYGISRAGRIGELHLSEQKSSEKCTVLYSTFVICQTKICSWEEAALEVKMSLCHSVCQVEIHTLNLCPPVQ